MSWVTVIWSVAIGVGILLSAKDDPSVRQIAMNRGASAFFIKGVESSEFLAGVKAAADSKN